MSSVGNWRIFFSPNFMCYIFLRWKYYFCHKMKHNKVCLVHWVNHVCAFPLISILSAGSSSSSGGGTEIESMLVTDRTGEGREQKPDTDQIQITWSRPWSSDQLQMQKKSILNQHVLKHFPDVFNNFPCFQVLQNFVFPSTRFTKHFKKLLAQGELYVGKSTNLLMSSLTV